MEAKRGYAAALILILSVILNGCTSDSYRAENETITDINIVYNSTDNDLLTTSEGYPSGIYIDNKLSFKDVSQLDYPKRSDLGFPRIERILSSYEQTIKRHSSRFGFDWRFILAVMNQESRFRLQAVSHRGAFGLMQIMPGTGRDVSNALGIDGVRHPEDNIAGGVFYLWRVRSMFDSPADMDHTGSDAIEAEILRLSLAAYNAGPTRVRDTQRLAVYLGLDPYRWDVIRDLLTMLTPEYYTLHQYVWENGRPDGGYFYGWPETINYVESVMGYYSYYQQIFE